MSDRLQIAFEHEHRGTSIFLQGEILYRSELADVAQAVAERLSVEVGRLSDVEAKALLHSQNLIRDEPIFCSGRPNPALERRVHLVHAWADSILHHHQFNSKLSDAAGSVLLEFNVWPNRVVYEAWLIELESELSAESAAS